ncbi:MAG: MFS transporter [Desulfovibrionales bacterium]|nr:MAG: MFS transporter [Desulfovibrionales bacterium]
MSPSPSPFDLPNVRRFLLFRVLFNARFYYPVFTILFLDYGLTLAQFTILNAVWAVTIVLAEVPSGALADIFGRRTLVCLAAGLMVLEMSIIALVPLGYGSLVFAAFLFNRICSGLAEAAASGADEALAYDTLKDNGMEEQWPKVLERLGRWMAVGFFLAMLIGAFVYDPKWMSAVLNGLGLDVTLTQQDVLRLPIFLTLASSLGVLVCAWGMRESASFQTTPFSTAQLRQSFARVFQAGRWILANRFVLFVILAGMILDSVARQFITLGAEYFRFIGIPIGFFGPIWAVMGLLGWMYAWWARLAVERLSPLGNLTLFSVVLMLALFGVSSVASAYGLVFVFPLEAIMFFVGFFQSHYINREVDSAQRATVLSFRGLALNIGFGLTSVYHSLVIMGIRAGLPSEQASDAGLVLATSLPWLPALLFLLLITLVWSGRRSLGKNPVLRQAG